jgi:IMP dehydrogenase
VKCLAAGADLVMLGSLLAGTYESPGRVVKTAQGSFKRYAGMASKEAQLKGRGHYNSIEGIATMVKFKGNVAFTIADLQKNIASGMSYSGARTIKELQELAIFQIQSMASHIEGMPHILTR